jgi:hypothetical protein
VLAVATTKYLNVLQRVFTVVAFTRGIVQILRPNKGCIAGFANFGLDVLAFGTGNHEF